MQSPNSFLGFNERAAIPSLLTCASGCITITCTFVSKHFCFRLECCCLFNKRRSEKMCDRASGLPLSLLVTLLHRFGINYSPSSILALLTIFSSLLDSFFSYASFPHHGWSLPHHGWSHRSILCVQLCSLIFPLIFFPVLSGHTQTHMWRS